jgi:hypothetical protein
MKGGMITGATKNIKGENGQEWKGPRPECARIHKESAQKEVDGLCIIHCRESPRWVLAAEAKGTETIPGWRQSTVEDACLECTLRKAIEHAWCLDRVENSPHHSFVTVNFRYRRASVKLHFCLWRL